MNNPAARLHSILTQTVPYRGNGTVASPVWAKILKVPEKEIALINYKVAEVFLLPNQIQEQIYRFDGEDHDLFLEWVPAVNKAIQSSSLNGGMHEFAKHITDATLVSLRHCSHLLSKNTFEIAADASKLDSVWDELNSLYEDVRISPDMDKQLKYYILRHLDLIRNAIRDYDIKGITPIIDSIDAIVGSATSQKPLATEMVKSTFGQRIMTAINNASTAVQLITSLPQLAEMANDTYEMVKDAVAGK